jgi:hypothetical protein
MTSRRNRKRTAFALESLEIRNAPSHFGMVAYAAAALHPVHTAAHVRHITDSEANPKKELTEPRSSVDSSHDNSTDSGSSDQTPKDSSGTESTTVDVKSKDY